MGFLSKVRVVVMAQFNDLLDKAVDLNSIPVLKQYVRDLEDAISQAQHQAAAAAAQVTTLNREMASVLAGIEHDKKVVQAFMAQGNDAAARATATKIVDEQTMLATLTQQVETAKQQSAMLDTAVAKMSAKHNDILSRVRSLEIKDRGARALEQSTASMKKAGEALGTGVDASVDDVARRIEVRNDVATEEFNRNAAQLDTPEDPTKTAAVDDLLASLKGEPVGAK